MDAGWEPYLLHALYNTDVDVIGVCQSDSEEISRIPSDLGIANHWVVVEEDPRPCTVEV